MTASRGLRVAAVIAGVFAVAAPVSAGATSRTTPVSASQQVQTHLSYNRHTLLVTARGRVLTLALQLAGTEYWQDASGSHAAPISASPVSIFFGTTNVVHVPIYMHPGATAVLSFTAEGANSAAVGSATNVSACHGDTVVTDDRSGGITYITSRTC